MNNKDDFMSSLNTLCEELEAKKKALDEREALLNQKEETYQASLVKSKELQDEELAVTFDIGGQLFKYKVEQIRKYPESLLCVLLEEWTCDGEVAFIARSGLMFSRVDCFIRGVQLPFSGEPAVIDEFAYYGLPCPPKQFIPKEPVSKTNPNTKYTRMKVHGLKY